MGDQIIVQIAKGWDDLTLLQLMHAPNVAVDDVGIMKFQCDPATLPAPTQPDSVKQHGQALLASLMRSHDRVKDALLDALALAAGTSCPIYVHLKALPAAEVFCWEALCNDAGNFMALDRRWQVGRIAGSPRLTSREAEAFEPPLRVMALLSAVGRDATPEWEGLYAAVGKLRRAGLPVSLLVGTGQEGLQDVIFQLGKTDPDLSQFPLQSAVGVIEAADEFSPHLVHFFSHGSTTFDKPRLQLATLNDTATSSIELALPDLLGSPGIQESWLTVLNCCESGAASKDVHSLTHSLVAGGVNAAIGMKETVSELDAYMFSSRLYPGVFETLRAALMPLLGQPGEATIDFAPALWGPRKELHDRHSTGSAREWTLPVLYARPELLRVRHAPRQTATALAHSQTIDEVLAVIPPEKRAAFLAELQAVRSGN
jgi:CHAT domain-containing protein